MKAANNGFKKNRLWILFIFLYHFQLMADVQQDSVQAEVNLPDSVRSDEVQLSIPENALHKIQLMDYRNTPIKDVIRAIATNYNLNIFVDDAIEFRITVRLTDITAHDALLFIVKEYGLRMSLEQSIYKIYIPQLPKPVPEPPSVSYENGLVSLDIKNKDISDVIRTLAETTGMNIVLDQGVNGNVTGFLQNVPFETGLDVLMKSNGFVVRKKDDIYFIDRKRSYTSQPGKKAGQNYWVDVRDSLVSLDVAGGELSQVVHEIARQMGKDLFILNPLKGQVNAQCVDLNFENVMDYLFKGTDYTYRKEDATYLIGDKRLSGIASTEMIHLNHIKAEGIIDVLPPNLKSIANLQVIKEHNSLMVVGTQDVIREVDGFIRKIDYPIPQILIEALVVDYNTSRIGSFGISAGLKGEGDTTLALNTGTFFPGVDVMISADKLNKPISKLGESIGIKNIGTLPDNFYMRLQALESQGKVNIRSKPQIATLNGHPASIKIGTTQYYELESYQPIVGGNTAFQQTTQRFEKITAEISLTITPWVSASGEITTEIHPEFSTPRDFNPNTPPTIDHRILESTVRLRDGETIVLGGLTQDSKQQSVSKLPILGDIPVLGRLFQTRNHNNSKSILMIYITPHLTYQDENAVIIKGPEE